MKIDGPLFSTSLANVRALARDQREAGYDGLYTFDGPYDPFLPLAAVAQPAAEGGLELATGVAIAFARNPMIVAQMAHDLHATTGGRFLLGLGSQIKPHVEHRFSMPWGKPVARMKEFVAALRAIFDSWNLGKPLKFQGEFYSHTLMPPMMKQPPTKHGAPPILVAGVGEAMLKAAGEVADGYIVHPFHSMQYLETFATPALNAGRNASGRTAESFQIVAQVLVITGNDDKELARTREAVRHQIAFYASTPAYKPVLDAEGFGDIQEELRLMTKEGRWMEMGGRITDEMLTRFAVIGTPEEAGRELRARYGNIASRIGVGTPVPLSIEASKRLITAIRA
jgi:probable F420-dependent oxidoreductase